MFEIKRNNLFVKKQKNIKDMNIFEKEVAKEKALTTSGNGALKYSTSGNAFVDDFASISRYKQPREIEEVFNTMSQLWSLDPIETLRESVYLRMITRETKLFSGEKLPIQIGQGLKAEYFMRMIWLSTYHPKTFKKNLDILISAGSWNDVFQLMRLDLSYEHEGNPYKRVLDWSFLFKFIVAGLNDPQQSELIKKYMPQIKSSKNCKTLKNQQNNYIAKYIANKLFVDTDDKQLKYKLYRQLKSSGTAHEWQQLISQQKYDQINFDHIAGRALNFISNSRFLMNHDLESKFEQWITSKPVAKFTGFPYELFKNVNKTYQKEIINKQFMGLIEQAPKSENNFIVCLDTSGSMESVASGTNFSSLHVARSMALYFSYLLKGNFNNTFLEFARNTVIRNWEGKTPYEKFFTEMSGCCGNTDVLSVAYLFVKLLQTNKEEDFPNGAILISDGEFDRSSSYNGRWGDASTTMKASTFENFKKILKEGGFSKEFVDNFKLVLWDIPNNYYGKKGTTFEGFADTPNFFYMSGFDPAGINFLTGKKLENKPAPKNAEELFKEAMQQELLQLLRI